MNFLRGAPIVLVDSRIINSQVPFAGSPAIWKSNLFHNVFDRITQRARRPERTPSAE
jgi:hypothetical protein